MDEENQSRKVEAEGMEECCELTCSSWLALPGSAQGWHCRKLAGPSHVNHHTRKYPTGLPTGQSLGTFFSIRTLSQVHLGSCQVDKNQPTH